MELKIKGKHFIVTGATSGFGNAIAERLIAEGADVTGNARTIEKLEEMHGKYSGKFSFVEGDITKSGVIDEIVKIAIEKKSSGIVINAGGPPAKAFLETELNDWDDAYQLVLRWKVELSKKMTDVFRTNGFGKMVFIESASIKQPMENLVLSTSFRLAVAGFVKTLAKEVAGTRITANILAPGFHDTAALNRIFVKKSQDLGVSVDEARKRAENAIPVRSIGNPDDFASLAVWLLSPLSGYVTGQTFSVDGGNIDYIFG